MSYYKGVGIPKKQDSNFENVMDCNPIMFLVFILFLREIW